MRETSGNINDFALLNLRLIGKFHHSILFACLPLRQTARRNPDNPKKSAGPRTVVWRWTEVLLFVSRRSWGDCRQARSILCQQFGEV